MASLPPLPRNGQTPPLAHPPLQELQRERLAPVMNTTDLAATVGKPQRGEWEYHLYTQHGWVQPQPTPLTALVEQVMSLYNIDAFSIYFDDAT